MKTNPRARYFCDEYLLEFLDDAQSESESEGPDVEEIETEDQPVSAEMVKASSFLVEWRRF
jgi:hypothetical protein